MSRVLLISYQFPPAGGVAVQRILSLAKYLPEYHHEVSVLTCRNPGMPTQDPALCAHIPAAVAVHRALSPEVPFTLRKRIWAALSARKKAQETAQAAPRTSATGGIKGLLRDAALRLMCPDPEVLWVPFALRRARRIIRRQGIGTVIVTAPPFSSYAIGVRLKREFPELKFVADYRDDWLDYYLKDFNPSEHTRRRAIELQREMVDSADRVVAVTRTTAGRLRSLYPDLPADRIAAIYNGYDPASFSDFRPRPHGGSKVVVTFIGTLHGVTSARRYLDAVDALPEDIRSRFETRFIGRASEEDAARIDAAKSSVRRLGFLPQKEALGYLEESDYLLAAMMYPGNIAAKVFEYLAAGKPILVFGPRDSEMGKLMAETGAGWCVDPSDPPEQTASLLRGLALHRDNPEALGYRPNRDAIRRYDRRQLAGEYSRLIEEIESRVEREAVSSC